MSFEIVARKTNELRMRLVEAMKSYDEMDFAHIEVIMSQLNIQLEKLLECVPDEQKKVDVENMLKTLQQQRRELKKRRLFKFVRDDLRSILTEGCTNVKELLENVQKRLRELDAYDPKNEKDVRALEYAHSLVNEILNLPNDQRATMTVYRNIHQMRTCVRLLKEGSDDDKSKMALLYDVLKYFETCKNLTSSQEEEIQSARAFYKEAMRKGNA